jgi:AraC family transcriptional regulator of adaptative response/methylated-DNA-[protein]-cysteine methyltransferase
MLAVASPDGLSILEFSDRRALERELAALSARWRRPILPGSHPTLERVDAELAAWFAGDATGFTVPLAPVGTPFQRRVWDRLAGIAYGTTASYAEIAKSVGSAKAVRAVGRANGANPLAIVIPCHRVVRSDGALCGYGGGLWRKRWLLEQERRVAAKSPAVAVGRRSEDAPRPDRLA